MVLKMITDGFEVFIRPSSDPVMCPVSAMKHYFDKTKHLVPSKEPVFIALNMPWSALSVVVITDALNKSIALVGFKSQTFMVKSFHPSGATSVVEAGLNMDTIWAIGRWKTASTFE